MIYSQKSSDLLDQSNIGDIEMKPYMDIYHHIVQTKSLPLDLGKR